VATLVVGCSSAVRHSHGGSAPSLLQPPQVTIAPTGGAPITPRTPIVVTAAHGVLRAVTVTNPGDGKQVAGQFDADKTSWTSTDPLGYGQTYHVVADAVSLDAGKVEQAEDVSTVAPNNQTYPSLTPAPDAAPNYGVGQVIGVSFDEDVPDKAAAAKALKVVTDPPQPGAWYWLDDRTAHYRPQNYWQPGTTITLSANVYGVDLGGGLYGQTDRTATYHIHDSWIAKADGKAEQMQIFHNGQLVDTMPISLGSTQYPSHVGPHVISEKAPSVVMDSCTYGVCQGQPGYYKETVYLDEKISADGEYVHSAPWSVGQQGSDNVSHGCVNLSPANAQWFFDHFDLGDVVEVADSGGPALPVWDQYGDWELSWQDWSSGGPNA
jgi:lipoprotein-anchoring transpeptidase ErfK/SrfK